MADEAARMVFTDPPYNVPIKGNVSGLGKVRHDDFAMALWRDVERRVYQFPKYVFQKYGRAQHGWLHSLYMHGLAPYV